jgi:DNA polymerase III alpha subunit
MVNIDAYIARKHGQHWTTPHKIMNDVLSETYGIIVYQEQVARLVNQLGGIERKRAFRLAKAISKKKTDMIEKEREPFVAGSVANGVAESCRRSSIRSCPSANTPSTGTDRLRPAFQTGFPRRITRPIHGGRAHL